MAITISGENNNDRILASDGVIDSLSGFNVVGVITATSFTGDLTGDVTGNLTGNVTGNINNTTLLLQTGGTERVRIDGSGVSSFKNKIIIDDGSNGHLFLNNTSSENRINSGTTGFAAYKNLVINAAQHIFKLSNTEKLRITSGGNVGIGSVIPEQRLTVAGVTDITHYNNSTINNNRLQLGFNAPEGYIKAKNTVASPAANLALYTTDTSGNTNKVVHCAYNGKVGINSTSPSNTLDVVGGYQALGLYRNDFTGNSGAGIELYFGRAKADGSLFNCATISAVGSDNTGQASQLRFSVLDSGSMSEKLRINSSGDMGLGASTIEDFGGGHTTLEVAGTTTSQGGVFKTATSDSAGTGSSGTEMLMFTDNTKGAINVVSSDPLTFLTANTERLRITSDGNITFGVQNATTAVTSAAIKYFDLGRDYWNGTKGDYRALRLRIYDNGNIDDMYGLGVSNGQLEIQSQSSIGFYASGAGSGTGRRLERFSINSSGHLKHTGLRTGNSENKLAILTAPSYNTSEEDVIIYQVENESGSNQLSIGAGTGSLNAMTALSFRTASAVNTLGGTERLRIDSNGVVTISNSNPPSTGAMTFITDDGSATTLGTAATLRVANNGGNAAFSVFEAESGSGSIRLANDGKFYVSGASTFSNNIRVETSNPGADGILGQAYGSYFGLRHADQTYGSEYMILSNNTHTFISCTSGYNIYIRPSANSSTHETVFAHDNTTFKNNVVMNGHPLRRLQHHWGHLEGSYNNVGGNSTKTNPIYTIGSSYNPDESTLSNMYGIGYSHGTNASFISFSGLSGWGLYVAADGDCRMFLDASTGKIAATGTISGGASDVRLKTNIKVIDNSIEKIKKIRGVTFDWVENITTEYDFHPDSMHETGVIAQEIQEVIPDAVTTAPFNGNYTKKSGTDNNFLTVKDEKIIPLCIEAIKELSAKVEVLEQENTTLKARVTNLESS